MIHIPVLRWGEPYKSLEIDKVVHFATGEVLAEVSRANAALVERDMRHAQRARDVLREIPINDLLADGEEGRRTLRQGRAAARRRHADARPVRPHAVGDHRPARAHVPVQHGEEQLRARQHGQDPRLADARPRPRTSSRAATASRHAACRSATRRSRRCSGMVLPSNSPGVHTLWLPIIPMQIGLVLKPGPQEPWTPYRMAAGLHPGRRPEAGDRHLSRPRRRRRRGARSIARAA